MRVITDFWVIAAMTRSEPRRQNGQVAISTSKTRPRACHQLSKMMVAAAEIAARKF
jgi:hypothetical protein